jgi:hypothetical protein
MSASEVQQYLGSTFAALGFELIEIQANLVYAERPAWAVFYRGPDCKLQVCWSSREGGVDFMLAPLDAPNVFGLNDGSKRWRFMLALSDAVDDLGMPPLNEGTDAVWAWRRALFDAHFEAARVALQRDQ